MQVVLSRGYGDGFFSKIPHSKSTDPDLIKAVLQSDQVMFDTAFWMLDLWQEFGHQNVDDFYVSETGDGVAHIENYMGYEYVRPIDDVYPELS